MRNLFRFLLWLLPASGGKNAALRQLGHAVAPGATAHPCVVWRVDRLVMAPGSRLGKLNVLRHLTLVEIGPGAAMGRLNLVSAHPVFGRLYPEGARLILAENAKITNRHSVDCSAAVIVGGYSTIAGHGSTVLTHSVDLRRDAQVAYPVTIGERSFVSTGCLMLGGAVLPDHSVLAAGAVLPRAKDDPRPGLWAGVPARRVGEVDGNWFTRGGAHTRRVFVPDTGITVEQAF